MRHWKCQCCVSNNTFFASDKNEFYKEGQVPNEDMNGNSLWQERPWLVVSASLWLADEINVGWKKNSQWICELFQLQFLKMESIWMV